MKHLSATPPSPPSKRARRSRTPRPVVLRALAKDPAERYQSAEEMDADLARVAAALTCRAETEEAATMVLRGRGVRRRRADRDRAAGGGDAGPRPPPTTPRTLLRLRGAAAAVPSGRGSCVLLVAAAAVAGFFAYSQIQDQLNEAKPVAVPTSSGSRRRTPSPTSTRRASRPIPRHPPRADDRSRRARLRPGPGPGRPRRQGQHRRRSWSRRARRRSIVPGVIGRTSEDAVAALTRRNWRPTCTTSRRASRRGR